jgi:hypothetical protein
MVTTKICNGCELTKPFSDFYFHNGKYATECKICKKKRVSKRYRENKETINAELRKQRKLDPTYCMLHNAKQRARRNNLSFEIVQSDIVIPKYCPILGLELEVSSETVKANSPTLDRIIPKLGYIKGNIQVISNRANTMKNDANIEELLKFANWVYKEFNKEQNDR